MSEFPTIALGVIANITMGQSPGAETYSSEENGLPFLQGCAEFGALHPQPEIYCDPPLRVAKKDSILVSVRAPVGTMNLADQDYCIGRGLGAVQGIAGKANTSFLRYAIAQNVGFLHRRSQGSTFLAISSGELRLLPIPDIGFRTQERIAEILSTLDKAIEKTEALIAKYQQIKAGLMHDLFTRGVTADGKLRPPREQAPELYRETPIGWIPKEWDACPIASLLDRIIDYRGKTPTKTIEGIPLITAKNVRMGFIDSEPREFIAERDYPTWMTRGIPINTDVVFTTEAPLGNVAQVGTNERVAFAQRVIILQPGLRVLPNFLRLLLMTESFQRLALRLSSGSTALGIKQSEFRKIMVGHPVRLDEQQFISDKLIALENYEAAEADKVEKLREQKLGLMSDLLTEKVRVLQ